MERLTSELRFKARTTLLEGLDRILRRRAGWMLWALALVPMAVVPPIMAVVIILLHWGQLREAYGGERVLKVILAIAALNIVGSAYALTLLSNGVLTLLSDFWMHLLHRMAPPPRENLLRAI